VGNLEAEASKVNRSCNFQTNISINNSGRGRHQSDSAEENFTPVTSWEQNFFFFGLREQNDKLKQIFFSLSKFTNFVT
jgi:hypothetical protein